MKKEKKKIKVKCPQCEKVFFYYDSKFRPFCSEKCKMVDLGHWFEESYKIASHTPPSEDELENGVRDYHEDE